MELQSVQLSLQLGGFFPTPAPLEVMTALQSIEIQNGTEAPSGFQMSFVASRQGSGDDYALVSSPLLKPWSRVVISVAVNGTPKVLMDGFITQVQLVPGFSPGASMLTVMGQDISVKMNLFEFSLEYPAMGDYLIANLVLAKYLLLGVVPTVMPTLGSVLPFEFVPQQNSTDLAYIKELAQRNGFVFFITPGKDLVNYAYFGPPVRSGLPQPALTVDMGPGTNVNSMQFSYNALAPTLVYGLVLETMIDPYVPLPVIASSSTRTPPLATDPAVGDSILGLIPNPIKAIEDLASLAVRGTLYQGPGLQWPQSMAESQAILNVSTDEVVTCEGELDVTRYGAVLTAPGVVPVRGAGFSYDGLYSVQSVTHKISSSRGNWDFKQSFKLAREGTGSTIEEV
ncbi:MAG TPA: hypothetical protein VN783_09090 [Thermoanaerobaculia bacterium]|nr:hypothetical protein [Thermoanaerobaculia bacterium]